MASAPSCGSAGLWGRACNLHNARPRCLCCGSGIRGHRRAPGSHHCQEHTPRSPSSGRAPVRQECTHARQQVRDADSQQVRDADSQQVRDAVCAQAQVHATGEVREVCATTGEVRKACASTLQVASIQVRFEAKTFDAIEYGWQVGATGHLVFRGRTSRFVDPSMMAPIGWPYRTTLMQRSGTWFLLEHCVPWADLKDTEAVFAGRSGCRGNFIFACAG